MKAHLQPQAGLKDLSTLMELISDPKKYTKIIKELDDMYDKINESIGIKTTIDKAQAALSEALRDAAATKQKLTDADITIEEYKSFALEEIAKKDAAAKKRNNDTLAKLEDMGESLQDLQDALTSKEIDLSKKEKILEAKGDNLSVKEIELTSLENTLAEKSKLMTETASRIS